MTTGKLKILPDEGHGLTLSPQKPQGHCVASMFKSNPEVEEDAKHLVTCWNACDGLADPSMVPEILKYINELTDKLQDETLSESATNKVRVLWNAIAKMEGRINNARPETDGS